MNGKATKRKTNASKAKAATKGTWVEARQTIGFCVDTWKAKESTLSRPHEKRTRHDRHCVDKETKQLCICNLTVTRCTPNQYDHLRQNGHGVLLLFLLLVFVVLMLVLVLVLVLLLLVLLVFVVLMLVLVLVFGVWCCWCCGCFSVGLDGSVVFGGVWWCLLVFGGVCWCLLVLCCWCCWCCFGVGLDGHNP